MRLMRSSSLILDLINNHGMSIYNPPVDFDVCIYGVGDGDGE